MRRWQPDVNHDDVRGSTSHQGQQILSIVVRRHHVQVGAAQDAGETFAQEDAVLDDSDLKTRYRHGISPRSSVPHPIGEVIEILPPSASTRSVSPCSPEPAAGSAPPTPSSVTSMTRTDSSRRTRTTAVRACACLSMLVSASLIR